MKQTELIELISAPHKAVFSDLEKLQDLKKQFPFFQSAHMLLTLVSKRYDSGVYQETLRKTAITIPNRARLYNLLNAPVIEEVLDEAAEEIKTPEPLILPKEEPVTEVQNQATEIEHLKAIELHSEKEKTTEEELTEQVEKEVEKQIITAFVEKEVLKTQDWYKPAEKKKEEIGAGSFSDWLQALKRVDRVEEGVSEKMPEKETKPRKVEFKKPGEKKAEEKAIIDKIIDMDPGNIRLDPNQRFYEANVKAKESLLENEHLVTETLAKIYALQGSISKAIRAYEILSLKFPQKSAYFASLIENLKKEKDNK